MQLEQEDVPSSEDCGPNCQKKRMMKEGRRGWERERIFMSFGGGQNSATD